MSHSRAGAGLRGVCHADAATLLHAIASGQATNQPDSIEAFKALYQRDRSADARLLEFMKGGTPETVSRVLGLLAMVSDGRRLVSGLMEYAASKDPHIRAQAALLIARGQRNTAWVRSMLLDPDPRVRANVVEGTWGWNRDAALLEGPLRDLHHRVVCNAIVALYKIDDVRARSLLESRLEDSNWQMRAAATWALGATGRTELFRLSERMQRDPHKSVRWNALRAMSALRRAAQQHGRTLKAHTKHLHDDSRCALAPG